MRKTHKTLRIFSLSGTISKGALLALGLVFRVNAGEVATIEKLLQEVPEVYVGEISTEQVAMAYLQGINKIDKNLHIGNDGDKISLYYKGQIARSSNKPESRQDVAGWVDVIEKVIDRAEMKSAKLRQQDFVISDISAAEVVKILDKDSKYYSELASDKKIKHRRNFAATVKDNNLLLKIDAFNNFTAQKVQKAIAENPQIAGIILDLRGSPGGQLAAALEVADLFLDEGIVVAVRGKNTHEVTYYNSKDGDIADGKPMVVLIDGDTASAAEVLTSALREQSRTKAVVGTKSFGKGTVQSLINLANGGTMAVSSAYYYTPSNQKIHEEGVMPDICTFEMSEYKNVDKILNTSEPRQCGRQSRKNYELEYKIAEKLLKI